MGILKGQTTHLVEGLKMNNGIDHKVWKTNFNMPVSDLFTGSNTMTDGYVQTYCNTMEGGTRDLCACGLFPGLEVAESVVQFYWCVCDASLNGNGCMYQCWKRGGIVIASSANPINVNISAGVDEWEWAGHQLMYMTGIDSDEVCAGNLYCANTKVNSVSGDDVSITACALCSCFSLVPSTTRCASSFRGIIWVEGNNLHFINANCWEHSMPGVCQSGGATVGAMWIDNTHYLNWVNSSGDVYKACWRICQFCSTFTNSSGPNPAPGAGYKGAIWADCEFGRTHLAYIGCDGNKYITGAGRNPTE